MKKLKIKDVQKIFNITRGTVYNWEKKGKLNIIKENGSTYIELGEELLEEDKFVEFKESKTEKSILTYASNQNEELYKKKYLKSEELNKKYKETIEKNEITINNLKNENNKLVESIDKLNKNLENIFDKFDTKLNELNNNYIEIYKSIEMINEKIKNISNNSKEKSGIFKKLF